MGDISYSAVVLDDTSINKLLKRFSEQIPEDWEISANHLTINLGEIDPEFEKYLGFPVRLKVEEIAMDDHVIAVGVSGFPSKNEKPHITLAINRQKGGKPMMSKILTNWERIKRPLMLRGIVKEIPHKFL